jgi:tungstate transport system ATP-binding protein
LSAPLYQMTRVEKWYGEKLALRVPGLTVFQGRIVGLSGPNGSGKSTLLRLLGLVESPSRGEILFKGNSVDSSSQSSRLEVTLLDQEPYLLRRTVYENIAYGLKVRRDKRGMRERVDEALDLVGLPARDFAYRKWYELSGGEAQRVALAMRLILKPRVLLLDEPTASVDAASARLIKEASLAARRQWGSTLVIASHDGSWLHEVCDEVLTLFEGRIIGPDLGNVLFGPWSPGADGLWEKRLQGGQSIRVPAPPEENAVAVIDPGIVSVGIRIEEPFARSNSLRGILSSLTYRDRTGDISATVAVDTVTLTAKVTKSQLRDAPLYPGQEIWVIFDPQAIRWL